MKPYAYCAVAAVLASSLLLATSASAGLNHDYELNGNLHDAAGGPDIVNRAGDGSLGPTGITFGADQGPTITGYGFGVGVYSVEMMFRLDAVNGYRSIIEPKNNDDNLYIRQGGLEYFPFGHGALGLVNPGDLVQVILTRNSADQVTAYLNGVAQVTFLDTQSDGSNRAKIDNELHFFNDDGTENSPGFVDYIRTYDVALNQDQVNILAAGGTLDFGGHGGVPEPAGWALMITGFGMAGGLLRRRRPMAA